MANVNHTIGIGITTGPKPTETPRVSETARPTDAVSEYERVEAGRRVAEAAEVAPQDQQPTRQDFERHKQLLDRIKNALARLSPKSVEKAGREGLVRFAVSFLAEKEKAKDPKERALLEELRRAVTEAKQLQIEMEGRLAKEGPMNLPKARIELAAQRLAKFAGQTLSKDILKDPSKVREHVIGTLRKKLGILSEARSKKQVEIRKWEKAVQEGQEKEKAERVLQTLRIEQNRLARGEHLFSQSIVHAENWIRELEKGQLEMELIPEGSPEGTAEQGAASSIAPSPETATEGPSRSGGTMLGISSVGGDESDFEGGFSEYVEVSGTTPVASNTSTTLSTESMDLTGTRLSVLSSSGQGRQEARRTKRIVQMLLQRLKSGDLRALDLALIMLSHQASLSTVEIGAKVIKSLDALDKHQQAIVDQLGDANPNDASFSSRTASMNIQANRIASDRVAVTNLLRDVISSMEEIQNIAKSYLDIQGAQVRQLSRFNT